MRKFAKISLVVVLFGQLVFSAMAYYLHVANPSWPFWIVLYVVSGVLTLKHITQLKLTTPDLYFFAFIGYVVASFVIIGESSQSEFAQRILLICIAPYLCGRILGKYVSLSLSGSLQVISFLYILLIGIEIARNPGLFQSDRLFLFIVDDWNRAGGDPTCFNIGITLGATWVVVFASLIFTAQKQGVHVAFDAKPRLLAIFFVFPVILLFIGSRQSVVSIILCAVVLLVYASWISTRRKIGLLFGVIAVLLTFYNFLPEQRRLLIDEIPNAIVGLNDYLSNIAFSSLTGGDGSVFTRVALLSEAWRLFVEAPFFGIGATNFGLRSYDIATEFASPHSLFAQVLVEYGLVGASLLALMLLKIFRMFLRRMRIQNHYARSVAWSLFSLWVFILIKTQFSGNLFYDYHLFLLTGLFVSCLTHGAQWATQLNLTQGFARNNKMKTITVKEKLIKAVSWYVGSYARSS